MQHAEFDVNGLSCELSVASVVGAMAFVPGVSAVTLRQPERCIRVSFDPRKASVAQIIRAARATGHGVLERAPESSAAGGLLQQAGAACARRSPAQTARGSVCCPVKWASLQSGNASDMLGWAEVFYDGSMVNARCDSPTRQKEKS